MSDCAIVLALNQLHLLEQCDAVAFISGAPNATVIHGTLEEVSTDPEFKRILEEYGASASTQEAGNTASTRGGAAKDSDPAKEASSSGNVSSERAEVGVIKLDTWCGLIKALGGWVFTSNCALALLSTAIGLVAFDLVLVWWLDDLEDDKSSSSTEPLVTLGVITVIISLSTLWRSLTCAVGFVKAARILNEEGLASVLYAPMRFFHNNPSGRIANRFSGDIVALESQLPVFAEHTLLCAMMVALTLITIAVMLPWFLVAIIPVVVLFCFIVRRFQTSFRHLKRLHAVSRSPCFQMLTEALDGRCVVRAFNKEQHMISEFEEACDMHSRCWFTMNCCQW